MKDTPLISICIPVYNIRPFIKRTINCVLNQDYPNYEVVVCDNVSNDGTWEYMKNLNHSRVRIYQNPTNVGPAANHNLTVQSAMGEYIKFLHADDELPPNTLSYMIPWVTAKPSIVGAVISCNYINNQSEIIGMAPTYPTRMIFKGSDFIKKLPYIGNQVGAPSGTLIRKDCYWAVGGVSTDLIYYFDFDLWLKMSTKGDWILLPDLLYGARYGHEYSNTYTLRDWQRQVNVIREDLKIISDFYENWSNGLVSPREFLNLKGSSGERHIYAALVRSWNNNTISPIQQTLKYYYNENILDTSLYFFFRKYFMRGVLSFTYRKLFGKRYDNRMNQVRKRFATLLPG